MLKNNMLQALADVLDDKVGDQFWDNAQLNALNGLTTPTLTIPNAAVLLVVSDEPSPKLLFTRRSSQLNAHAGEVSFVGGKKDDDDPTIIATALREASEEVGLTATVQILGQLPKQLAKSGLVVQPIVGAVSPDAMSQLLANPDEIDKIFWVSLSYFLDNLPCDYVFYVDNERRTHHPQHFDGTPTKTLTTPAWCVDDEVIWGMTGRILASLLQIGFGKQVDWYYRVQNH